MWWHRQAGAVAPRRALPSAQALRRGVQVIGSRWQATATRRRDGQIALKVGPARAGRTLAWSAAVGVAWLALAPHAIVAGLATWPAFSALAEAQAWPFHASIALLRWLGPPLWLGALGRLPWTGERLRYHAAEHQVMAAFEAGLPLTTEGSRGCDPRHDRCGGNVAVAAAGLAGAVQVLLGPAIATLASDSGTITVWLAVGALELIGVAGATALILRWSQWPVWASGTIWVRGPGRLAQRLTTRAADDGHRQVALTALRAAVLGPDARPGECEQRL